MADGDSNGMQVGRKGLGKTTWISNMQAVYGSPDAAMPEQQADESEAHAESEDSQMLKFLKDPCHMLSEMTLRDDSSHVTHHICMQVCPLAQSCLTLLCITALTCGMRHAGGV